MENVLMDSAVPVCVFGYNRPLHLKKCLDSLAKCEMAIDTDLYIFCDGKKNANYSEACDAVCQVAMREKKEKRFKNVFVEVSKENRGLAKSVISGVTEVINLYGKCIVLEDDLIVSKYYLKYMNQALKYYEKNKKIWSVTGYTYPLKSLETYKADIYLSYRICSYGWGTWKNRWEKVDWDVKDYLETAHSVKRIREFNRGGNDMFRTLRKCVRKGFDVWAIKFSYAQYKNGMFTIYPRKTLIESNGYDGSGTNSQCTNEYQNLKIDDSFCSFDFIDVELNKKVVKEFKSLYRFSVVEWMKYKCAQRRKKRK